MSTQAAVKFSEEAGIPRGVINLVHGDGSSGARLARADIDHICFTTGFGLIQLLRTNHATLMVCSAQVNISSIIRHTLFHRF